MFRLRNEFLVLSVLALPLAAASLRGQEDAPGAAATSPTAAPRAKLTPDLCRTVEASLQRGEEICLVVGLNAGDGHPAESSRERHERYSRAQEALLSRLDSATFRLGYRYRFSPIVVLRCRSPRLLRALEANPQVEAVEFDSRGSVSLLESRPVIRADEALQLGVQGEGRVVAVLDTGVDNRALDPHPDLHDAIIHEQHFLRQGLQTGEGAPDRFGHGTHVSGIVASRGRTGPPGIAPKASIIAVKVLADNGTGYVSDWAAGVEYVVCLHKRAVHPLEPAPGCDVGIRVDAINMSFASTSKFSVACDDSERLRLVDSALRDACREAHEEGILLLGASGNAFSLTSVSIPACFTTVMSVGSVPVAAPDEISDFTNRNNTLLDILAPGEPITSTGLEGEPLTLTGTSQAVPHVTGVALLLLEIDRSLPPEVTREILVRSGVPVADPKLIDPVTGNAATFPRLDALGAIRTLTLSGLAEFSCLYDPQNQRVRATWTPRDDIDAVVVRLSADGEFVTTETLDPRSGEFSYTQRFPRDARLEVCATANQGGFAGLPTCCEIDVSRFVRIYKRTDCNNDGHVRNIADAIMSLGHLFRGQPPPPCQAACDMNDDGGLDISDPIFLLNFLFLGGRFPPPPHPGCGLDPTPDPLSCESTVCI